ncbi:hypothetical protein BV898_15465 [Hypsibius exemplaris]|uniref:Uncharacterized protein n=1 Tax=Hypsibius exemplaris TaxID=2072580 RepID=A0A9X6NK94_HYPEX|nr:hypothetical protein BV898_15465 [Hypsibius exemplaris]
MIVSSHVLFNATFFPANTTTERAPAALEKFRGNRSTTAEQLAAKIDKAFQEAHSKLKSLDESNSELDERSSHQRDLWRSYRTLTAGIAEIHACCVTWLEEPLCPRAAEVFLDVYNVNDPFAAILKLHNRIVDDKSGFGLLDNVVQYFGHDQKKLNDWRQVVTADMAAACHAHSVYLIHKLANETNPKCAFPKRRISYQLTGKGHAEIPAAVLQDIKTVQRCVAEIHAELSSACAKVHAFFRFRPCGDSPHHACSYVNGRSQCNQLSAKVHDHLWKLQKTRNDSEKPAKELAQQLRTDYPHFGWSVVIFRTTKSEQDQTLRYDYISEDPNSSIWHQTLGSSATLTKHERRNLAKANTPGHFCAFGRLEVLMDDGKFQTRTVVFWADKNQLRDTTVGDPSSLQSALKDKLRCRETSMLFVMDHHGFRPKYYDMDLEKVGDVTFPLHRGESPPASAISFSETETLFEFAPPLSSPSRSHSVSSEICSSTIIRDQYYFVLFWPLPTNQRSTSPTPLSF